MSGITPRSIEQEYGISGRLLRQAMERSRKSMRTIKRSVIVTGDRGKIRLEVARKGVGMLISNGRRFYQFEFEVNDRWKRYSVLFAGSVDGNFNPVYMNKKSLLVRLDSGCETGQIAGDLTCDCKDQLSRSMKMIAGRGEGMVIRMPMQEGKGTGLRNKLAAHLLENELGISNVEAAYLLLGGSGIDIRTYSGAIAVLKFLGVGGGTLIRMMTNNPRKLAGFAENGYRIKRIQLRIKPNRFTYRHLKAKQRYLGHIGLI